MGKKEKAAGFQPEQESERWYLKPFGELTCVEFLHIVQAREEVFFLEQRVTCPDADPVDTRSIYLWVETPPDQVIGFLRIIPPGVIYPEASIGRVLVRAPYRRRGLGRRMMQHALRHIETEWGAEICISAQAYLEVFYRSLGFAPITPLYYEAGIPHVKMRKGLSAEKDVYR